MTDAPNDNNWVQWTLTLLVSLFTAAYGFILKHILSEQERMDERQNNMLGDVRNQAEKDDDFLWNAIKEVKTKLEDVVTRNELDRLRQSLEDDRRIAVKDRADIAGSMVTRTELDRQLDLQFTRLVAALRRTKIEE